MGKGTDKLYITHSEWSSSDAYGTSKGVNAGKATGSNASFKRLPYNYCAVSLQPFNDPVCTSTGTIFDLTHILTWLSKHNNTNPVDGSPLKRADLIELHFHKNEEGEYVDPVTYKVFTDNTHIIALGNTGNVFAWDTIERLNIKAKNWKDLVTDVDFSRKDIITLQDPQNIESRNFGAFKHIQDGETPLPEAESNVNSSALGSASKILKAKEAVAKARADRELKAKGTQPSRSLTTTPKNGASKPGFSGPAKPAYNAAVYTSGKAAASFTSTGMTPHTANDLALLSEEEYMLVPKRIKTPGYARLSTTHGDLNLELLPEFAPKAVYNFVRLAQRGYYTSTIFHRNIRGFMIQGGDPTGTGRGGSSFWGAPFADELEGPRRHDARGIVSMANKGKDTNTSQFFITYRAAPHLDRKHTVFGRVVGGLDTTLSKMEQGSVGEKDRPDPDIRVLDVVVFVDPFEEWRREREEGEKRGREEEEVRAQGGREDERVTWTGKRIREGGTVGGERGGQSVGKYLHMAKMEMGGGEGEGVVEEEEVEPVRKKAKGGGFGNFDGW
ncbi:hypothetical protein EJ04DRAFT_504742 [Polyplosphaeria fusca]|uniref:Peptidyl-prolyl cis-trans isomerase-like 2 n=1 Tax=Polyplosphaeria fusca TaxID=682080 RepID=A0A9P4UVA2_9PLEO|nr:hypothetical protein EJ04DRAFT_504742 [Polyplosphaeria fusca]